MKRFTETTKWSDPWFRKLTPEYKCLWGWLLDNCDGAGVIDIDIELAAFQIGAEFNPSSSNVFDGRLERLPDGKWLILKFIEFQCGELSEACRPHQAILKLVKAHGIEERVFKGYSKGIDTPQEQEQEKEQEKKTPKKRKSKAKGTVEEIESYCIERGLPAGQGQLLFDKWEGNGWKIGTSKIEDWRATVRNWKGRGWLPQSTADTPKTNGANPNDRPSFAATFDLD